MGSVADNLAGFCCQTRVTAGMVDLEHHRVRLFGENSRFQKTTVMRHGGRRLSEWWVPQLDLKSTEM